MQPRTARPPELEETFLALRRVMAAMRGRFHGVLREHGLTFPQWILLKDLRRNGRMSVSEIAETLDVSSANVTGIVDRLETAEFAERSRSPDDKRVVFVHITEKGRQKTDEVVGRADGAIASMFEGWSKEELAQLRASLARLRIHPEEQVDL